MTKKGKIDKLASLRAAREEQAVGSDGEAGTHIALDRAKRLLAEALTVGEAVKVADMAAVAREYARRARLSLEAQNYAAEIHLRAQRKAGEFTTGLERGQTAGLKQGARRPTMDDGKKSPYAEALEEAGATRQDAQRWERLAGIDADKFDAILLELATTGEITTSAVLKAAKAVHVSHNAGDNEWYTPAEYIKAARAWMGDIDLDPASSSLANETVQAAQFFTAEDNGLLHEWHGRVWMNPPYAKGLIEPFAAKLAHHVRAGDVTAAVALTNNSTDTGWFAELAAVSRYLVFPRGRVGFINPDGEIGKPLQGQMLFLIGDNPEPHGFKGTTVEVVP